MDFAETQFPTDIAYGSSGGPVFSTEVVVGHNGSERRNQSWSQARARYNLGSGIKTPEQMAALIAFFRARAGRATGFRFKDWSDFVGLNQPLGIGNGTRRQFPLVKRYSDGGQQQLRPITKPVHGSVTIYANGVAVSEGVSVNPTNGVVTFTIAPAAGITLTADYEFDVPVRFDTDHLDVALEDVGTQNVRDIALIELRLPLADME